MKDMNIAKLTSDDLPLFLGITSDLFPDVTVPTVDYEEIINYITKEAVKLKLQVISTGNRAQEATKNDGVIFLKSLIV